MVIRARPGVFQGVPHSIIRNGLDPDRDLNAFTHVFLSWWTLKFQFGQHSKITWDTPYYAQGPWHSLVQICTTVDMCQRNIGALTRPLSPAPHLYLCPLSWLALIVRLWNISHTFFLCSLCQPLSSAGAWPGRTKAGHKTDQRYSVFRKILILFWIYGCCCLEARDNASKFGLALPRPALILDLLCKEKEKPCALTMNGRKPPCITMHFGKYK